MKYLLLHKYRFKILGPMNDESLSWAELFYRKQGFKTTRIKKPPAKKVLDFWKRTGYPKSTDGCRVKGLCSCLHGHRSWLAITRELVK